MIHWDIVLSVVIGQPLSICLTALAIILLSNAVDRVIDWNKKRRRG